MAAGRAHPLLDVTVESAGLLPYRRRGGGIEVLLVHPGGPYWARKDAGAWQIAKGLVEAHEDAAATARREAREELGVAVEGSLLSLGTVRQAGGKLVHAFAVEADLDADTIRSNEFEMEWPPRSGTMRCFPEIDRARWYALADAGTAMLASQRPFLHRLREVIAGAP